MQRLRSGKRGGHISALGHGDAAIGNQRLRVRLVQFVLRGAGQGDIAAHAPDAAAALSVYRAGHALRILADAAALHLFDLLDDGQIHAVFIHDEAVAVAHGYHLRAQLHGLLRGVNGHVAAARYHHALALKGQTALAQHGTGEVAQAKARCLPARQRAAVGEPLAGQNALVAAGDALVLAVQITDFARAHADIARGHVRILADVLVQLGHKALAEAHDLLIALALGVKIAAALGAADGQGGQAVFEHLLHAQKLDDGQVDAGVQAQAALVGADGVVELHAVAAVDPHLPLIVQPGHTEDDDPVGLDKALEQAGLFIFGVLIKNGRQGGEHFLRRLQKFLFMGVARAQPLVYPLHISVHDGFPP